MNIIVASAQYPISKHKDFKAWSLHTEQWVAEAAQKGARLLLFPEYGSMELLSFFERELQESVHQQIVALESVRGDFCTVFAELARKYELIIVAPTFPVLVEGFSFNRAYVFSPKGLAGYQDKFFITRFEGEEWGVHSAPKSLALFEASWGSFGIQICYDVEFTIGSKMLSAAGAFLILAPSCTETIRGATRVHIGARARALETQAYSVVSQTVGKAPWVPAVENNFGYTAFYCAPALDMPEEGIFTKSEAGKEGWLVQSLDFSKIEPLRSDSRVFNFRDHQRFNAHFSSEDITLVRKQV